MELWSLLMSLLWLLPVLITLLLRDQLMLLLDLLLLLPQLLMLDMLLFLPTTDTLLPMDMLDPST